MSTLLAYLALTKPRVIELLLVTAIPAMLLADRGAIHPLLMLNTLVGGMMAAAGANTLNCVADADIDKVMKRTARRPFGAGNGPDPKTRWALRVDVDGDLVLLAKGAPRTCWRGCCPWPPSRFMCSPTRFASSNARHRNVVGGWGGRLVCR
ncbi:cytochrome C oxidase assembly factor ctaB [Mycobacterium tuberculosis 02_1987]|nr:cytochrome C oxidase assembly factor ctaB [Mycobacterium tuberculosis 02_1987]